MTALPDTPRLLLEAHLSPLQGSRFQPTGFPDLGAASYKLPDGTDMLLVESAQSVANRLEATIWDEGTQALVEAARGLSYVEVQDANGVLLTTSLHEAHRLNSPYIIQTDGFTKLQEEIGYKAGARLDLRRLARVLFKYDVNCLLHGVFLTQIAGLLRLPRALSGFIEAQNVSVASSGGVKNDRVDPKGDTKKGFGNVPFHRDEFVADTITAYFNLDLRQLHSYGLGETAEGLLYTLALWKVQRFLSWGLRLRTACDFNVNEVKITTPGVELPSQASLNEQLAERIAAAQAEGLFADPTASIFQYKG